MMDMDGWIDKHRFRCPRPPKTPWRCGKPNTDTRKARRGKPATDTRNGKSRNGKKRAPKPGGLEPGGLQGSSHRFRIWSRTCLETRRNEETETRRNAEVKRSRNEDTYQDRNRYGTTSSGSTSSGSTRLGLPISDLELYMPVVKKHYRGPFNVNVV